MDGGEPGRNADHGACMVNARVHTVSVACYAFNAIACLAGLIGTGNGYAAAFPPWPQPLLQRPDSQPPPHVCSLHAPCSSGTSFGIALAFLLVGTPVAFVFWYRPFYRATKYGAPQSPRAQAQRTRAHSLCPSGVCIGTQTQLELLLLCLPLLLFVPLRLCHRAHRRHPQLGRRRLDLCVLHAGRQRRRGHHPPDLVRLLDALVGLLLLPAVERTCLQRDCPWDSQPDLGGPSRALSRFSLCRPARRTATSGRPAHPPRRRRAK